MSIVFNANDGVMGRGGIFEGVGVWKFLRLMLLYVCTNVWRQREIGGVWMFRGDYLTDC